MPRGVWYAPAAMRCADRARPNGVMTTENPNTGPKAQGHWADEAADQILLRPGPHRISTGISPSGPIHVGNLRETLTGDAVARVLRERGAEVRLEFVADDFDPLRRVYPFLDEATYSPLVGRAAGTRATPTTTCSPTSRPSVSSRSICILRMARRCTSPAG